MALRGNLKDFSLPDVFQLVTFSKKTGVLRIRRADGSVGSVWFRDGEVFFAQSNWHGEPLGERLVHASKITPSALARALDIRDTEGDQGRRLGAILVDEGYITDKVLEAFVQEQIQDTIFDLMRWDEGEFDFELLPEVVDEDIGLAVSIENVIMEGSRRLEEWARIKKKIPSMDIVFKMATAPGEGTFEISLKPIEWNLLLLVDGTLSVADLARTTNRTDFEVARIMYGLFSAGLLEVAADEEVERLRAERAEQEKIVAEIRSKQAQAEAEAAQAAVDREAALEAEARARAESAPEAQVETAEEPPSRVTDELPREPQDHEVEVPEFLAGDGAAATPEDMAIFEQMMGAVLEAPQPAVEVEPEPEAPSPLEPESAAEVEPDSMFDLQLEPTIAPESPAVTEPVIQDVEPLDSGIVPEVEPVMELAVEPEPELEPEPEVSPDIESSSEPEPVSPLEGLLEPESEILVAPEPPEVEPLEVVEKSPDELARDLMALGLGELPGEDLLSPMGAEESPAQADAISEQELMVEPDHVSVTEPEIETDLEFVAESKTADDLEFVIEPETETDLESEPLIADLGFDVAEAQESDELPVASSGAPDFSEILESLEDAPEIVQTEDLEDDFTQTPSGGGVISTDAFLADIDSDALGMGISSGLGDELSALTGAGGSRRPTASVNRIPEAGSPLELHRDQTVDKDLVMKIIEGIKNL